MFRKTKQSLQAHKLAPKKRFGQNFLVHRHTAEAIVTAGGIGKQDKIVEVGVGLGALTIPLAEAAGHVFGLEIDSGIIRLHQEEKDLPDNVTLIHGDVLKTDFNILVEQCGGPLKIMANLPYSISNPFLFKLIENHKAMAWASQEGHIDVLDWWKQSGLQCKYTRAAGIHTCENGHVDFLGWWYQSGLQRK